MYVYVYVCDVSVMSVYVSSVCMHGCMQICMSTYVEIHMVVEAMMLLIGYLKIELVL